MSGENPVFSFARGLEEKPYGCSAVCTGAGQGQRKG